LAGRSVPEQPDDPSPNKRNVRQPGTRSPPLNRHRAEIPPRAAARSGPGAYSIVGVSFTCSIETPFLVEQGKPDCFEADNPQDSDERATTPTPFPACRGCPWGHTRPGCNDWNSPERVPIASFGLRASRGLWRAQSRAARTATTTQPAALEHGLWTGCQHRVSPGLTAV
jgi:hypothetical protein